MLYEIKYFLSKKFKIKDLGEAFYVIGIEIHQDRSRGILSLSLIKCISVTTFKIIL
jgi:hypothetical protein